MMLLVQLLPVGPCQRASDRGGANEGVEASRCDHPVAAASELKSTGQGHQALTPSAYWTSGFFPTKATS